MTDFLSDKTGDHFTANKIYNGRESPHVFILVMQLNESLQGLKHELFILASKSCLIKLVIDGTT